MELEPVFCLDRFVSIRIKSGQAFARKRFGVIMISCSGEAGSSGASLVGLHFLIRAQGKRGRRRKPDARYRVGIYG
jgi:hypothetical protein